MIVIIIILYRQDEICYYYWGDKRDLVNHNNNYYATCTVCMCSHNYLIYVISQSIIFCDIYVIYVCSVYIHLFEHTMSMHVYSNYYGAYACLASAYKQYL